MKNYYEPGIVPSVLNPEMSENLSRDVAFFMEHGYLLIDDAISPPQLTMLRELFDEHVIPQWLIPCGLLDIDRRFAEMIANPTVLERVHGILGTCVQLHSIAAITKPPGAEVGLWHRDGPWPMAPCGTPYGSLPGQVNCGYYLDPLDDEIGPVWVIPGSQRSSTRPPRERMELPDQMAVYPKPGQALLFDGWLWHRGGANQTTDRIRRNCMYCYQSAWCKSREDMTTPVVQALREAGDAELKLLLGGANNW